MRMLLVAALATALAVGCTTAPAAPAHLPASRRTDPRALTLDKRARLTTITGIKIPFA